MSNIGNLIWTEVVLYVIAVLVSEVLTLNGANVCMVQQKYNITKLVKYRAPMSIRTYEWCFSMPPRCSKWNTEMRDMTKFETEERIAEVAVCCPGYKMRDVSCVPVCPNGKTGVGCSEDCPKNKWGPNCVNNCKTCSHGTCSPLNGECLCEEGWQGESCEISMPTTTVEDILTTTKTVPMTTKLLIKATSTTKAFSLTTQAPNKILSTTTPSKSTLINTTPAIIIQTTPETFFITIKNNSSVSIALNTTEAPTSHINSKTTSKSTIVDNLILEYTEPFNSVITTTKPINKTIRNTTTVTDNDKYIPVTIIKNDSLTETTTMTNKLSTEVLNNDQQVTSMPAVNTITTIGSNKGVTLQARVESATVTKITDNIKIPEDTTKTVEFITENSTPIISLHYEVLETTEPLKPTTTATTTTVRESPKITTQKLDLSTRVEAFTKSSSTTVKFKPREIWIKPAQKGDSAEIKFKNNHELPRHKSTNKELQITTTPKTIIVSIIPTSVSYAIFKKIALTTAAYISSKSNANIKNSNKIEQGFTKAMSTDSTTNITSTEFTTSKLSTSKLPTETTTTSSQSTTQTTTTLITTSVLPIKENTTMAPSITTSLISTSSKTNGMTTKSATTLNRLTVSTNTAEILTTPKVDLYSSTDTVKTRYWIKLKESVTNKNVTKSLESSKNKTITKKIINKYNKSLTNEKITTETPADEEVFNILTEPEHITAVMVDKENERTSMDLKSVISIAGGVMMAVITVAVIIVMIERCKKPRYEDVRKINDIRMQVMIDNDDSPPPYVRSIFHSPLPEPPLSDKCHYQPISTLDRNLKQFMRPVVVQTISPIMLENFRGILECHYDHLPRRNRDFEEVSIRHSVAPSLDDCCELRPLRSHDVTDIPINAVNYENRIDEIDNTTAEPLYAEIPCWRSRSEHAIEIMNINGEAVTEL